MAHRASSFVVASTAADSEVGNAPACTTIIQSWEDTRHAAHRLLHRHYAAIECGHCVDRICSRKPIWLGRQPDGFSVALFRDALGGLGGYGVANQAKGRDRTCGRRREGMSLRPAGTFVVAIPVRDRAPRPG